MRLATYNVENLFDRAKVMNLGDWKLGRPVLEDFAQLNQLLGEANYTAARKQRMVALLKSLGLEKGDQGPFVILRRNRGALLKRPKAGSIEIVADGRAGWAGSLELIEAPVSEETMRNTARVIGELEADVLAVVEAENRPALLAFNEQVVPAVGGTALKHVMLIDGNDSRGIDVGLLTGPKHPIVAMRSHVDDRDAEGSRIFSRDCPEYGVALPGGGTLWVLVNHLKSQGFGSPKQNDERRTAQAERVRQLVRALLARGERFVAVVGDLNAVPSSPTLAPLLANTTLKDIFTHPRFDDGGFPGTWGLCNASNKLDYLLLSPALWKRVRAGGVLRKGMWPGVRPRRWETYDELKTENDVASDHAALWVDLDL